MNESLEERLALVESDVAGIKAILMPRTCPVCGRLVEGRASRIYDTSACRQKAYRARRRANV